jgi:acyl-CoA dehydrogenase
MDFSLGAEEEQLRREVQEFVLEELIPLEPLFDRAPEIFIGNRWKTRAKLSADPEIQRYVTIMEGLERKAEDRGFWHLDVPRAFGGRELSNVGMIAVTEELEKSSVPFEFGNHVSNILYACKNEQVDKFLWPCIRGEKTSCFALTEPGAGSDPSMLATTAIPDGDHFILNGCKVFPTFASRICQAARDASPRRRDLFPGREGHARVSCAAKHRHDRRFRPLRDRAGQLP